MKYGSGGIAPRILNPYSRRKLLIGFTPQPLYRRGKLPLAHRRRGWVDPRAGLEVITGLEPQSSSP